MKVALCHQGFACGDAIGNDIAGMYRLLEHLGARPTVICDWSSRNENVRILKPAEAQWKSFDLIIYHHSQYWGTGDDLVRAADCPVVIKYHNVTPARFFQPYCGKFYDICRRGEEQTETFIATPGYIWLTDSAFSRTELTEKDLPPDRVRVVPPFNRVGRLLARQNAADYAAETIDLLFVGRLAPNKGHLHLLRVLFVLNTTSAKPVRLRIVGAIDPLLEHYQTHIEEHIAALGLENEVEIRSHCDEAELLELFHYSHIYLCLSEHEGFNVPVIESQAIGLPVVGAAAAATAETAGPGQLFSGIPASEEDDHFYAALVEAVLKDDDLRRQLVRDGERNVTSRFTDEIIENSFVEAVYDLIR